MESEPFEPSLGPRPRHLQAMGTSGWFVPGSGTNRCATNPGVGLCGDSTGWVGQFARPGGSWWLVGQVRVRELEEQCRSQTERFSLLAQELQAFRLHPGPLDLLTSALGCPTLGDHPPPPCCCSTPQPCRGLGPKGKMGPSDIIWEFPRLRFYRKQRSLATHQKPHSEGEPSLTEAWL